jgi:alginate O-acetyltransferase complex protein AlgI
VLFSSPAFFVFFLVYFTIHVSVPARYRVPTIIVGSTIFYAWWRIEYVWLPYALMAVAHGGVTWMEQTAHAGDRKRRAAAAIVLLFLPLLIFKYSNFLYRDVFGPLFGWRGTVFDYPLPLGVSFITFTLTAYVVDVYRGVFPGGRRASTVLGYVLFFPHLIAGPILRPVELIPQLENPAGLVRRRRFAVPIAIFTLGLVKKLVFADPIAEAVDAIYRQGGGLTAPAAWLAVYGFSVQIYCDFSGYTDMAIGLALMLGVRLPNNFLRPYTAVSIVEFWRRWHITLSLWLRDYLYIPLGGNRSGRVREVRNILITMTLGGLWHGANWTFVIWGLVHGVSVAATHTIQRALGRARVLPRGVAIFLTFHLVTIAWVFFRAPGVRAAADVLAAAVAGGGWAGAASFLAGHLFVVALIATFFLTHRFDDHRRVKLAVRCLPPAVLWPILLLLWMTAVAVSQGSSAKFIYFDF